MKEILSLILFILFALPSCTSSIKGLPLHHQEEGIPPEHPDYRTRVQIKYLGAGGFLIRRGNHTIMTAPFFSNPSLAKVLFWKIQADPHQIDRSLDPIRDSLRDVRAILVGHAHYDHLMDLPYVVKNYTPQTTVYGSETMTHILAPVLDDQKRVSLNERIDQWLFTAGGRICFMPLASEHAPHFMGVKVFGGKYEEDLEKLPTRAGGWREGQTLAYLIDFMSEDGKEVEFRIHYQDAASNPPLGFPPAFSRPEDQRRVDVAILCVPGFDQVKNYPEGIVRELRPRAVILAHWENFFQPLPDRPQDLHTVPGMDARRFIQRLKEQIPVDAGFTMPLPGAWMIY